MKKPRTSAPGVAQDGSTAPVCSSIERDGGYVCLQRINCTQIVDAHSPLCRPWRTRGCGHAVERAVAAQSHPPRPPLVCVQHHQSHHPQQSTAPALQYPAAHPVRVGVLHMPRPVQATSHNTMWPHILPQLYSQGMASCAVLPPVSHPTA